MIMWRCHDCETYFANVVRYEEHRRARHPVATVEEPHPVDIDSSVYEAAVAKIEAAFNAAIRAIQLAHPTLYPRTYHAEWLPGHGR